MTTIEQLRRLEAAATKGPWTWAVVCGNLQLHGDVYGAEMNPVLVAAGCGSSQKTSLGLEGCLSEGDKDPMRACALHPEAADRDLIAALRNAATKLFSVIEAAESLAEHRTNLCQCHLLAGHTCPICVLVAELDNLRNSQ